jgi:hypothetical protein
VQLFHYRDHDQVEVDMVLKHPDGTVVGIEVKSAETVRARTSVACAIWPSRLGDRFRTRSSSTPESNSSPSVTG